MQRETEDLDAAELEDDELTTDDDAFWDDPDRVVEYLESLSPEERERAMYPDEPDRLSEEGIARQNAQLLAQYRAYRQAADAVADAWRRRPEVRAVALIGSAARYPWKEAPRFKIYRRNRIEVWHEIKDVDLAVWLDRLDDLNALRRSKTQALKRQFDAGGPSLANHQVEGFILEPGTDRYLGRLCKYNRCPKGKPACRVPGCGEAAFLQQHKDFAFWPSALRADRMLLLYDRETGARNRAADLPLPAA